MARPLRRQRPLRLWLGAAGLAALTLVLVLGPLLPGPAGSSGARRQVEGPSSTPVAAPFSASVTFQGIAVANHTDPGAAIDASFGAVFITVFDWRSPNQATLVTQGTLTVLFLGATVGTTSNAISGAVPGLSGNITLTSDFSQDKYLLEGVYQLETSLFDHGQAIWNTSFYVWVHAPYHLTVINVALLLIGIFEVYQIAALGSVRVARKQLGLDPPPKQGGT